MNNITIEQASRWLAVTNLGGPHIAIGNGAVKQIGEEHVKCNGPRGVQPLTGYGIDRIWNMERQGSESDEMYEAYEVERRSFEKDIRSRKSGKYWRETLAKEGLIIE